MKKSLLLLSFFFGLWQLNAQITLEKSDFTAEVGSSIYRLEIDPTSVTTPQEGANQVWDYTSLVLAAQDPDTTILAENDDFNNFPDANIANNYLNVQNVGPLPIEFDRTDYLVLNDSVYGNVGVKYNAIDIPITSITGGPMDSINYNESYGQFSGTPSSSAWFPMNVGDSRGGNSVVNNDFLLTVAAFGLDHVPNLFKAYGTVNSEVVGWGSLLLPDPVDQTTVTLDVLLVKRTSVQQDSFFTAGAPMPQPLLDAFGVTQGQEATFVTYRFFAKGFPDPVFINSNGSSSMLSDLTGVTSSKEVANNAIPVNYYPNPNNGQLNLEFEKTTNEPWVFSVYNAIGQKVFDQLITQPIGNVNESISFNKKIHTGNYFYVLHNEDGRVMSSGGLVMK